MDEANYAKCSCDKCGAGIEFPSTGTGLVITCPHCGAQTTLGRSVAVDSAASPLLANSVPSNVEPALETSRRTRLVVAVLTVVIIVGAVAVKFKQRAEAHQTSVPPTIPATPATPAPAPTPAPLSRSLEDFKVGAITLEKGRGNNLVYAVGVLKNTSSLQRFGVTIELEMFDKGGRTLGNSSDYKALLEPKQEWRFRALVLNPKTTQARLVQIREAE